MGPIITKRERLANRHFGVGILFIIRVVIVIWWKQRVLAGTDGMMDRVVSAATVQSSKAAVTFAGAAIVRMRDGK